MMAMRMIRTALLSLLRSPDPPSSLPSSEEDDWPLLLELPWFMELVPVVPPPPELTTLVELLA